MRVVLTQERLSKPRWPSLPHDLKHLTQPVLCVVHNLPSMWHFTHPLPSLCHLPEKREDSALRPPKLLQNNCTTLNRLAVPQPDADGCVHGGRVPALCGVSSPTAQPPQLVCVPD